MRRAAVVVVVLVLSGASCDPGELNPEFFDGPIHTPPSDWLGGDPGSECSTICNRIDVCYPNRTDIRNNCRSLCPGSAVAFSSCRQCLQQQTCALIESGACRSQCAGMQNLTCMQSWSNGSLSCDAAMGCVCRPPCTDNGNLSSQCNSGCCVSNQCVPQCACNNGYQVPTGC